jgi:hypothetical protein
MSSSLYRGYFVNDKPHGRGIYLFNNIKAGNSCGSSLYYVGEFNEGIAEGKGKVVAQGMLYEGSIKMGELHCDNA